EKHKVTLVFIPCWDRHLAALSPSRVVGNFTTTCWCQLAYSCASLHIPPASVAMTSTLTGPLAAWQISMMVCLKGLPSLATREGLVVTPSRMPRDAASRISLMLAVSTKNFMTLVTIHNRILQRADSLNGDCHFVAGHNGSDSRRRAGQNQIAGMQRHDLRDEA